jgi:excisionase family DNA binding protein
MSALPKPLYDDLTAALAASGREDLMRRLEAHRPRETLSSGQAAALLGVASTNTVKNWLEAGYFPRAFKTAGGHWRFYRDEVDATKARMDELREKNRTGVLAPTDLSGDELSEDEEFGEPPLL